jgi:hypothetical protein
MSIILYHTTRRHILENGYFPYSKILTMLYHICNHLLHGFCALSCVKNNKKLIKHYILGTALAPLLWLKIKLTPTHLCHIRKANPNLWGKWLKKALPVGHNWVGSNRIFRLRTATNPAPGHGVVLIYYYYLTRDNGQRPWSKWSQM